MATATATKRSSGGGGATLQDKQVLSGVAPVGNDGEERIIPPFSVAVTLEGVASLLMHAWSNEEVEAKAAAAKGSKSKKTDNLESYVYRNAAGQICVPARYFQRAVVEAARFHQDPRSTRKMAKDLVAAGLLVTAELSPLLLNGRPTDVWEYLDRQRVMIQRSAITRSRPAFSAGWRLNYTVTSLLPEYITPPFLRRLVVDAGRFVGLADFRPTYGRFDLVQWDLLDADADADDGPE